MPISHKKASSDMSRPALTVREVAEYLNVDEKTVYRLVQRRELPGFKVAGAWRFRPSELDRWIEASADTSAPRVRGAQRLRALIVEDDEVDRMAIRRALQQSDPLGAIETREVATLLEARQALSEGPWDCIILDRRLPDGDGASLLEGDNRAMGDAAVVVLTGLDDEEKARALLRGGAQDYLVKGRIEGQSLLRSIRYSVERKRFDELLRGSEANFRGLIEHSPDAICVLRDRHIIYANPAFVVLVTCKEGETLVGLEVSRILHPEDEARMPQLGPAAPPEREGTESLVELRLRFEDKSWVTVEAWTKQVRFDEAAAVVLVCRDISRRRALEDQVLFSSRMAAVGTMAAGVAHELNSPLSYVLGNLDFVQKELVDVRIALGALGAEAPLSDKLRGLAATVAEAVEALGEARQGADRLKYIIRDLKTFARPTDAKISTVPLRDVVDWSLGVVAHEIRHRARVVKDYRATPEIFGNEAMIGQIAINLLVNAAHALPEGRADEHTITVTVDGTEGDSALLAVRDTGCGILPENLARIFDPFFTTKPIGKGTGLGLSVCHGIVTSLGGSITVESEVGVGTIFRVHLPLGGEEARAKNLFPREVAPPAPRGRVLMVDDDRLGAAAMARTLSKHHEVTVFRDAREALATLARDSDYQVILCALMMPGMGGVDLYFELAEKLPQLKDRVVFVTGGALPPRARQFLDTVPNLRVEKPLDFAALRAVVHERVKAVSGPA